MSQEEEEEEDKVRQRRLKLLHSFYPTNADISYFENRCTFHFVEMRLNRFSRLWNMAGFLMINAPRPLILGRLLIKSCSDFIVMIVCNSSLHL